MKKFSFLIGSMMVFPRMSWAGSCQAEIPEHSIHVPAEIRDVDVDDNRENLDSIPIIIDQAQFDKSNDVAVGADSYRQCSDGISKLWNNPILIYFPKSQVTPKIRRVKSQDWVNQGLKVIVAIYKEEVASQGFQFPVASP